MKKLIVLLPLFTIACQGKEERCEIEAKKQQLLCLQQTGEFLAAGMADVVLKTCEAARLGTKLQCELKD